MIDTSIVTIHGDCPTTNTLIIAEYFGKQHKDVMRDLRALMADCGEDFNGRNFAPVEYYDKKGEKRPMYEVTRDGFALLAMGFTGSKATKLKIAFIQEFSRMESDLKNRQPIINDAMRAELLAARPLWAKIAKYLSMELSLKEICLLIQRHPDTLRKHRRRMEACGLLTPPSNLAQLRRNGLVLLKGGVQ
ncbi:MAG TPA: Rha family transcriptional regulator [Marinagarivorans sp.]|nr:Rha family transcriptional regulator [Cellvibrionaceae bacterium]HMY41078.1 Rha family transcriptional regulator [Marinagarivorans sp.]